MKYVKVLSLAGALAGLMAFVSAGSASATELTCGPAICPVGTVIHADSEGHIVLHTPAGSVECGSTIQGVTTNVGSAIETVKGNLTSHVYSTCKGGTITVLANGSFEIHTQIATKNNNGTLTSSGTQITVLLSSGIHCIYTTNNTHLGTITGSANTGATATLHLEGTSLPRTGGTSGAFCGSTAQITGSYLIDIPMVLNVD
jgi:hypothetical protein